MFKTLQRLPFPPRLKTSRHTLACMLPQSCVSPVLFPACWCRLPLALCTAATLACLLFLEHSHLRPLFLLGAHSFILLVLLRCHLPTEAFLDHLFKIVISHVCTPCPTFCIIIFFSADLSTVINTITFSHTINCTNLLCLSSASSSSRMQAP